MAMFLQSNFLMTMWKVIVWDIKGILNIYKKALVCCY